MHWTLPLRIWKILEKSSKITGKYWKTGKITGIG
jgi:hypothetical protein